MGLNYDILDTTAVVSPMEPALRDRDTSGGHSIWCERDGVHLSREAYINIAGPIIEATLGFGGSDVDEAASRSSESSKRRQPDSVVTLQALPPPRKRWCRPEDPNEAGWLTWLIRPPLPRYAEHIALEATAEVEDVALIS